MGSASGFIAFKTRKNWTQNEKSKKNVKCTFTGIIEYFSIQCLRRNL